MKFDVVLGNPPYQSGLWKKFLDKSINLATRHVCFIAPDGVTQYSSSRKSENLKKTLLKGGIQQLFSATRYFPGVASGEISAYILDLTKTGNEQVFVKKGIQHNIVKKVLESGGEKLNAVLATQYRDYGKFEKSDNPKQGYIKVLSSASSTGYEYIWIKDYRNKTLSGSDYWFSNRFFGSGKAMALIELTDEVTLGQNIVAIKKVEGHTTDSFRNIYTSKLFQFVLLTVKNGKFDTPLSVIKMLPAVPPDQELYEYFNLTQEEIDLIETTIK